MLKDHARRMVAASMLWVLAPQLALAQAPPESPTASAAETVGVPPPVSAPPAAEAQAPQYVAPGALELALQELHAIQKREAELWKQHQRPNIALPAMGIAVGLPMFGIMLPIGAVGLSDPYDENEARDTRQAATLVALGILGLAALAVGSTGLVRMRRKRLKADHELNSLADRRTLLENMIEAGWRATRATTTP